MENFNLTNEDYEEVESLKNIEFLILDHYENIRNLEINGEKESEEYDSIKESLESLLSIEKTMYKKLNNLKKIDSMIDYLTDYENIGALDKEMPIILGKDNNKLVNLRVVLMLIEKGNYLRKLYNKISHKEDRTLLVELNHEVKKDVINTMLTILNMYINDFRYMNISDKLINLKYNLGFIYNYIEDDYLDNDFEINKNLYWSSNLYTDFYNIHEKIKQIYELNYAMQLIEPNIIKISMCNLSTLKNKEAYAQAIISQICIRAGLLFSTPNLVIKLRNDIQKALYEAKNSIQEEIFFDALYSTNYDIELPNILSLKRS